MTVRMEMPPAAWARSRRVALLRSKIKKGNRILFFASKKKEFTHVNFFSSIAPAGTFSHAE